ncbi:MAG: bile acid:sodium symporter [Candidatus Methanoplasma sp.]|nr:bile acid:sodium symporter [Candidatus Methanoplasma sp.]
MSDEMSWTSKLQPIIIIAAVGLGLFLGGIFKVPDGTEVLIEIFLIMMLFIVFLSVDLRAVGKAFKNVRFTSTAMFINFIWTPVFAVVLGYLFLSGSLDMRIGLIMLLVTPCTDWYIVFTAMAKGNVPQSTSLLPLNLVTQMIMLPLCLFLFVGTTTDMDLIPVLQSVVIVLILPLILAMIVKVALKRMRAKERADAVLNERGNNLQMLFLCLAIVVMFAAKGHLIFDDPVFIVTMFGTLGVFFIFTLALSQYIGRMLKFSYEDTTSLTFTTMARNSPLDLAIAVIAFPDNPLIALVLVVGPLIELPILALTATLLLKLRKGYIKKGSGAPLRVLDQ